MSAPVPPTMQASPETLSENIVTAHTVLLGRWNPFNEPILYHQSFVQPSLDVLEVAAFLSRMGISVKNSGRNDKGIRTVQISPEVQSSIPEIVKIVSQNFDAHPALKATHLPPPPPEVESASAPSVRLTSISYQGREYTMDELFGYVARVETLETKFKGLNDLIDQLRQLEQKLIQQVDDQIKVAQLVDKVEALSTRVAECRTDDFDSPRSD